MNTTNIYINNMDATNIYRNDNRTTLQIFIETITVQNDIKFIK